MGGQGEEHFQLSWKAFHENISTNFRNLRQNDYFQDVTLYIDGNHYVSAHKVILSSCSPYFHSLLSGLPQMGNSHPVIVMPKGVEHSELVQILDYIYYGEVSIPSSQLSRFIEVGEQFQVRGLNEKEPKLKKPSVAQKESPISGQPEAKRRRQPSHPMKSVGVLCPACNAMCKDVEALKLHIAGCRQYKDKQHKEARPQKESRFVCEICDQNFPNVAALDTHTRSIHFAENISENNRPVGSVAPSARNIEANQSSRLPTKAQSRPSTPVPQPQHQSLPTKNIGPKAQALAGGQALIGETGLRVGPPQPSSPCVTPQGESFSPRSRPDMRRNRTGPQDMATTLTQRFGGGISVSSVSAISRPSESAVNQRRIQDEEVEIKEEPVEYFQEDLEPKEYEDQGEGEEDYPQQEEMDEEYYEGDYEEDEEGEFPSYDYYGQG